MDTNNIKYRRATKQDITFMSEILVDAALASGVRIPISELSAHKDTYQYVEVFPRGSDVGIIAETDNGQQIGAAWVRLLSTNEHAVKYPLPELTMGVISEYRRMGIGEQILNELYMAASEMGIPEISLGVHKDNLPAIRLYKKQGTEDGKFQEYIMMSRKLNRS
ncbi:MAG: GNAT family N-acetyltransferase [Prevotella sp.]|jgi:ribosomal protein S18 acetylase RimI-like enzyme|nr:GNAT family N-acetyltransferase [Prevotella sp.]